MLLGVPLLLGLARALGCYTIVNERRCHVYVLFGKVVAVIRRARLHFLWFKLGIKAPIVNWVGRCYVVDMRLDQQYLRSQPVNSEEGAPMGIGIWYEMYISDPVAFLFKNADPRGLAGGQRQQRHRPLPEQYAAAGNAREPPHHEPDRAQGGLPQVATNGATSWARSTSARCTSATRA